MRLNTSKVRFLLPLLFFVSLQSHANGWAKVGGELASPFTTPARGWLLGGSLLTGLTLATDYEVQDPLQESWSTRKPLGEWADVGDHYGQFIPNAAYILAMGIGYWSSDDPLLRRRAILMLKGSGYAVTVNYALKLMVREKRPNGTDNKSFPSGHSASAFAFSTVVWAEHGWKWGVPATMLATLTGASRINDNMHRLHDVIAGATVGIAYGLGIWYQTEKELSQSARTSPRPHWSLMPIATRDLQMVCAQLSF